MSKKLGFALIGCGLVGPAHARSLRELTDADLKVACSRTESKLASFADEYQLDYTTDYDQILERDDIDVVDITTPPWSHEELVTKAAKAGKHVVLEKPIATSIEEAERLTKTCADHGVKLAIIFQNRWRRSYALVKRSVDNGDLGDLLLGDTYVKWFRPQSYYDGDAWRGTHDGEGGGALINQGIHNIDSLQWIMGPIDWLFGQVTTTPHHDIEVEDLGVAQLRFKNGAMGVIEAGTGLKPGLPDKLEIHGTKGVVVIEGGAVKTWDVEGMDETAMKEEAEEPTGSGSSDPMAFPISWHKQQLQDMIDAIAEDRPPAVDGNEGTKALRIVLSIYESSKQQQIVRF